MTNNIKRPITLKDNIKTTPTAGKTNSGNVKKSTSSLLKIMLVVFVLIVLLGVGLAVGLYLKVIDGDKMVNDYKLHEAPIIGQFFPKPPNVITDDNLADSNAQDANVPKVSGQKTVVNSSASGAINNISDNLQAKSADINSMEKEKQKEEAKRISKLARLYGAMQPEEAVNIFNQLNDDNVLIILSKMEDDQVAKILAAFDAKRSARLTQMMMIKKQTN